jgi:arabinogalactan endo-1,4-beta-galactosidase
MPRRSTRTISTALIATTVGLAGPLAAQADQPAPAPLQNASFDAGLTAWTVSGDRDAAKVEGPGRGADDAGHLTHWSDRAYDVTTSQRLTGLGRGWWTVSVWVRSGGGVDVSTVSLRGCGRDGVRTVPTTTQDDQWVRLSASAEADGRRACTVALRTSGAAGSWLNADDVEVAPGRVARTVRGVDLSGLAKNEDHGAVYRDADGRRRDPVRLLAASGANLGRLKVWVDPADGYNDTAHVVATARRIKAAGMRLLVDFHYSDRWTDPGAQQPPRAWQGHDAARLAADVSAHTTSVLRALRRAGIRVDLVQVGNEINPGLLLPFGQTYDVAAGDGVEGAQWDTTAALLTAGARAVKAVDPRTHVLLHLTNINNGVDALTWWFDNVVQRDVPFDLIGLSYYSYWHGSLADLQHAVSTLSARYDRDVMVLETSYPWTLQDDPATPFENVIDRQSELAAGYPASPAGQAANFRAVQDAVVSAPGGRGLGAIYWEPAWTSVTGAGWDPEDPQSGNAWENQALFDHDGRLLPAARELAPDRARRSR